VRPILAAALGLSALTLAPLWLAAGCAAGNNTVTSNSTSGTGGASTSSSAHGGAGGHSSSSSTGATGGSTGAAGHGGASSSSGTGGLGGSGGTACVPVPEVCDGKDNNCDGVVDEGCACKNGDTKACYTGDPATLNVGVCVGGTSTCDLTGTWGPCTGEVTPTPEVCDGLDNDCNGTKDEGLGTTTCGQGICTTSTDNCIAGVPQTCVPGTPQVEKCNGVDDSCNGVVDEGCMCTDGDQQSCYTGPPNTQNVGECKNGTQICGGGTWGPCQGDAVPGVETCNAKDDDCDGTIDDGLGSSVCGVGACQAVVQNCVGGQVQTCTPGQPTAEVCNGKDDDCNGTVDDGLGTVSCGIGACANTVPFCKNGLPNVCNALPPQVEVCDGIDNNCNGVIDDGNPGGGGACTTGLPGVCAAGTVNCVGASLQCVQNVQPSAEVCDGKDNDCNGMADEGNPGGGANCNTGLLGACAPGTTACTGGSIVCNQNAMPVAEVCDGVDNNCNGAVDEGNPGGGLVCNTGNPGVCSAGTTACTGGSVVCNQNLAPSAETCDGLDNNCNGMADEGNPGGGVNCNTGLQGVCSAGITACQSGAIKCNATLQPSAEICDGKDNDCDGTVDNGNPGGGIACNTGKLGVCAAGVTACQGGMIVCVQTVLPSAETCDGLDNDCDGVVDNGNPGGAIACPTGKPGVCAAGTTACAGGMIVCNQNVQPSAETCDGLDNNCDGQVDEGNPGSGANCNTGLLGVCGAGTTACAQGAIKCNQNVQPSAETCDGLDNNCNGAVDENVTQACYTGAAGTNGVGTCHGGTQTCSNGSFGACVGQVVPAAETCDGLDNNCNGTVDDGNPGGGIACSTGKLGVCAAGTTACTAGAVVCNQNVQPSAETCDGLDNNCNGAVDESVTQTCYTGPAGTNGVGACHSGTQTCSNGTFSACVGQVVPTAETCDGVDNNCNGQIDESVTQACYTGPAGTSGVGPCHGGTQTCSNGSFGACVGQVLPAAETCNGIDDNCNGSVDENVTQTCYTGAAGTNGVGPCHGGTQTCSNGSFGSCVGQVLPTTEICDGLDNNCNGTVDDGNPGGGLTCGTGLQGVCSAGTTACSTGAIHCNQNVLPSAEVCDGLDNNCNGSIDEGVLNTYYRDADGDGYGNAALSTLACSQPTGYVANSNDCNDSNAAIHPGATEICNGVDDNCDGAVDEGNPGGGVACGTGLQGVCAAGTTSCSSGAIKCNQTTAASAEICDGKDNNCDGQIDNNAIVADGIPNLCTSASNKTVTVAVGGTQTVGGYIDPAGDDFFVVTFSGVPGAGGYYHPKIALAANGGQFKINVFTTCGGAAACSMPLDTFEELYQANPTNCQANTGAGVCTDTVPRVTSWIVQVTRVSGAPFDCTPYSVTITDI
jgi:hypothetical protein